ncbi:sigma non-opioid intracellular receptor 1 [Striga asiatica]|uniref:Sigma non-opioid intracellular receptor 1 n=1 Tax=Striga asiatica TaxID=4170 RepID=A0A5A7PJM3_STRAF|nr:sigma non-opioid intracellular receptor 1 [Striga asiatica]
MEALMELVDQEEIPGGLETTEIPKDKDRWQAVESQGLTGGIFLLWAREVKSQLCFGVEVEEQGGSGTYWYKFVYASSIRRSNHKKMWFAFDRRRLKKEGVQKTVKRYWELPKTGTPIF